MAGRRIMLAIAATALVAALCGSAVAKLRPNPADDPRLIDQPIEDYSYDYAERCRKRIPPGTKALEDWLAGNVRGETWSIKRCEALGDGFSLHAEGRAIDWHLDATVRRERRAAKRLIRTLLKTDANGNLHALARRMGVQGLIYNCKQWYGDAERLGPYSYCFRKNGEKRPHLDPTAAHRDHVHIELNWAGARMETSFWESPLAGGSKKPAGGGATGGTGG